MEKGNQIWATCPRCLANPGQFCKQPNGKVLSNPHKSRPEAVKGSVMKQSAAPAEDTATEPIAEPIKVMEVTETTSSQKRVDLSYETRVPYVIEQLNKGVPAGELEPILRHEKPMVGFTILGWTTMDWFLFVVGMAFLISMFWWALSK